MTNNKFILKHNELIVLNSKGKPIAGFKVKNPMEGLFNHNLKGVPIVRDNFAITQAQYHGYYE